MSFYIKFDIVSNKRHIGELTTAGSRRQYQYDEIQQLVVRVNSFHDHREKFRVIQVVEAHDVYELSVQRIKVILPETV